MDIHFKPVLGPGDDSMSSVDWVLFDHGNYCRPIVILTGAQVARLIEEYEHLKKQFSS